VSANPLQGACTNGRKTLAAEARRLAAILSGIARGTEAAAAATGRRRRDEYWLHEVEQAPVIVQILPESVAIGEGDPLAAGRPMRRYVPLLGSG
jgi:hypothetical protein